MIKLLSQGLLFALVSLGATSVVADRFNAALTMVQPIALQETTQMNIGAVLANDFESCELRENGLRSGEACYGQAEGTLSLIRVEGTVGMQVFISLNKGVSPDKEMVFDPVLIDNGQGSGNAATVTLRNEHYLSLGGTLTIIDGAQARVNNISSLSYQVAVTYQ